MQSLGRVIPVAITSGPTQHILTICFAKWLKIVFVEKTCNLPPLVALNMADLMMSLNYCRRRDFVTWKWLTSTWWNKTGGSDLAVTPMSSVVLSVLYSLQAIGCLCEHLLIILQLALMPYNCQLMSSLTFTHIDRTYSVYDLKKYISFF